MCATVRLSQHSKQVLAAKLTQPLVKLIQNFKQRDYFASFCFTEGLKCQVVRNTRYLGCAETLEN